jgi:peptide/nickel transport system permease protein
MLQYIAKRFVSLIVVMFLVAALVFFLTRLAPGDPAAIMLGDQATAEDVERLREVYGLDKPVLVQFGLWLKEIAQGNLGRSIFLQQPVGAALLDRAELTFFLTIFAVSIAAAIGIPAGIASAVWRGRAVDQVVSGLAMLAANIPSFWLGLIFIQLFAVRLGWFPVAGYGPPGAGLIERLSYLMLPAAVLGIVNSALITRFTRASMLDVLDNDYIRTARSKGLSEWRVVMRHAFGSALIPIVTVVGLTAALMIGGAIVTETVFGLPGIGNLVVSAVLRRDYPVIQGALIVVAAIYVLINLAIDLLYAAIDPRVRY